MSEASQVIPLTRREVKKRRNVEAMIGRRFGRWIVLRYAFHHPDGHAHFGCMCDCGNERIVAGYSMTRGQTVSCGCYSKESLSRRQTTHGETIGRMDSVEHYTWHSMIQRCEDENHISYPNYGARGIQVCARWRGSFAAFLEDMGRRPSDDYSIGRIDNSGDYEPSNCRWETSEFQQNNRRSNRKFTHNGETLTIAQWARRCGIGKHRLRYRLVIANWPIENALTLPARARGRLPIA